MGWVAGWSGHWAGLALGGWLGRGAAWAGWLRWEASPGARCRKAYSGLGTAALWLAAPACPTACAPPPRPAAGFVAVRLSPSLMAVEYMGLDSEQPLYSIHIARDGSRAVDDASHASGDGGQAGDEPGTGDGPSSQE